MSRFTVPALIGLAWFRSKNVVIITLVSAALLRYDAALKRDATRSRRVRHHHHQFKILLQLIII